MKKRGRGGVGDGVGVDDREMPGTDIPVLTVHSLGFCPRWCRLQFDYLFFFFWSFFCYTYKIYYNDPQFMSVMYFNLIKSLIRPMTFHLLDSSGQ